MERATIGQDEATAVRWAARLVEILWLISWAGATALLVISLLQTVSPGIRQELAQLGFPYSLSSLPFQVRYDEPRPPAPGAAGNPSEGRLLLVGHDDVLVKREGGDVGTAAAVATLAWRTLMVAVLMGMLYQLRALLRAVRSGRPFDPLNPVRIRRLGLLVIAAGVLDHIIEWVRVAWSFDEVIATVKHALPGASVGYEVRFQVETVVIGLAILAIAQAFEAGVRLQRDQDLTI